MLPGRSGEKQAMGAIPRIWRNQRQRYTLTGQICRHCGHLSLSPRAACPRCSPTIVEADLWLPEMALAGELVAYAVLLPIDAWKEEMCIPVARLITPDKEKGS